MVMNVYVLITGCDSEALALPSTAFFLLRRYPPCLSNILYQQIKRWMAYQYAKDHDLPTRNSADDPMAIMMAQLTGTSIKRPHKQTAFNLWGKANREEIEKELAKKKASVTKQQRLKQRSDVTRSLFKNLPQEVRDAYEQQAKDDHDQALAEWDQKVNAPPSQDPKDQQR